jgi:N utilization substance protein B
MQALCEWDAQRVQSTPRLLELFAQLGAAQDAVGYAIELVERFWSTQKNVDDWIGRCVQRWDLSRVSPVERNAMRVAVVEGISGAVPPRVALNEAIEIGKEFGGADTPRFINGVLDAVWKTFLPALE